MSPVQSNSVRGRLLELGVRGNVGRVAYQFDSVPSTNDLALELARQDYAHGAVVIAAHQSRGRGRLGRHWVSLEGRHLYMSVLLRPKDMSPADAGILAIISAVAAATAIRKLTGVDASIKWPNDIECSGRKMGGILIETRLEGESLKHAIVGLGINIDHAGQEGLSSTSLSDHCSKKIAPEALAAAVCDCISNELASYASDGAEPVLFRYRMLCNTFGRKVVAHLPEGEPVCGVAMDLDEQGRLIIKPDKGASRALSSAEITMLRPS